MIFSIYCINSRYPTFQMSSLSREIQTPCKYQLNSSTHRLWYYSEKTNVDLFV